MGLLAGPWREPPDLAVAVPLDGLAGSAVTLWGWTSPRPTGPADSLPFCQTPRVAARVSEIARKGSVAAHSAGTAHEFSSDEAREAGRQGSKATHARRREAKETPSSAGLLHPELPSRSLPDDMQTVAPKKIVNAVELTDTDGIFVLCYRESDDTCGGVIHAPKVSLDSMIGMVVEILGSFETNKRGLEGRLRRRHQAVSSTSPERQDAARREIRSQSNEDCQTEDGDLTGLTARCRVLRGLALRTGDLQWRDRGGVIAQHEGGG